MDAFLELFSARGRANRSWYFWHILLDDVVMIVAFFTLLFVGATFGTPIMILPMIGVLLAGLWAGIAMTVKRLHDLDRPGWHFWLSLVPIYNLYLGFVLLFKKGTAGPNTYGEDPLTAVARSMHLEA